ncbi:MAG TPA: FAD-dependent oxidoreductase [Terriglobia bacterium]|nr:FAD-dependent oxidoreductase [Terriglobia bacterium]
MWKALGFLLLLMRGIFASAQLANQYDLVVYGGTASGVMTAVAAAREGLKVALLEPGLHLGGMVSGGLGATDFGKKEVIGGISLEFFQRVGHHYGEKVSWYFEPHVAEAIFREMIKEAGVKAFFQHRLREKTGVRSNGNRIEEIFMEEGQSFQARVFADASYEGDLMAQAGVTYTWGREGVAQYGESLAGVREHTPYHQFAVRISPYDAAGHLLPGVSADPKGEVGAADRKVQAYNFRLCMTKVASNRVPFPRPDQYDPKRYELLARMLQAMMTKGRQVPRMEDLMNPVSMPNGKTDTNNNGAFSTDYIGGSWAYPEADYQQRERIWKEHRDYVAGFLYFLSDDPQVPEALRREVSQWGLAKDEFIDTRNWPHQLYVREARRMVGEYVMTQRDIQTEITKTDSIGMGSYNSDSHNVQRIATTDGAVENEGDVQVPVTPYQIPYRLLLPKRQQVTNLLVPVCFSASHVAYSTLRMEPQYMIIGQATGLAAKLAIEKNTSVQKIDVSALRAKLRKQGAVLALSP